MRIVSLCPSNTEIIGFLGLAPQLVGTDNYSDWPETTLSLPKLGPDLDIDMDALEKLKPDLVVASLSVPGMEKNVIALSERGIPHIVLNPSGLSDIGANLMALGEAACCEEAARRALRSYQDTLDKYRDWSAKLEHRPHLYWEWWPKPVFTPGGGNWLTEISELAGGRNVFAEKEEASVKTDWEAIRELDPDYMLLAWVGIKPALIKPELVRSRPGADRLKAVRLNRVYAMAEALYCRPSPRLLVGLEQLAALLHPEAKLG